MPTGHSFAKYNDDQCYDGLYSVAEKYVIYNCKEIDLRAWNLDEIKFVKLEAAKDIFIEL